MTEIAEAPAAERDGAITRIPHWIGGTRVDGTSGRTGPVYNPATGVQRGAVDLASAEEVDAAVRNANEAFRAWRGTSIAKRGEDRRDVLTPRVEQLADREEQLRAVGQGLAILHSLQRSASAGKPAVDAKRAPRITDSN